MDSLILEPNDEDKVNELGNILNDPTLMSVVDVSFKKILLKYTYLISFFSFNFKTYDKLTARKDEPNSQDACNRDLINEILYDIEPFNHKTQGAAELTEILQNPHLEVNSFVSNL